MSQMFSTDSLPAADRIDAWRWNAQQICGDCRIKLPRSSFHGSIDVRSLRGLKITRFSSSPLAFWKWPAEILGDENRSCIVITQLAGMRQYMQNGASVLLQPGDTTVIDSGHPWCSTCSTDCTRLYLRVPRWMMENYVCSREIPIAERIRGEGLGASLCRLSQRLYDQADRMSGQEGVATTLDGYLRILAACLNGGVPGRAKDSRIHGHRPGPELREKIQEFIEVHLSDIRIGPNEIASALGISVRHLHRLFSATGTSVADFIRLRRLEECRNDLENPRLRSKTITEIAFFWGFSDSAHFSRSFSKQFGAPPRDFRARAWDERICGPGNNRDHSLNVGSRCARLN